MTFSWDKKVTSNDLLKLLNDEKNLKFLLKNINKFIEYLNKNNLKINVKKCLFFVSGNIRIQEDFLMLMIACNIRVEKEDIPGSKKYINLY